jgi:hypothetical protein
MSQYALDGSKRDIAVVHERRPGMSQGMKTKPPDAGFGAKVF